MDFNTYQELSKRTLANLGSTKLDLCHMTLGMFGEYNKLVAAIASENSVNTSKEICDIIWFISNYYTLRGYKLHSAESAYVGLGNAQGIDTGFVLLDLCDKISQLQDIIKNYIVHDREIDKSLEIDILYQINSALGALCFKYNIDINKELQNNIGKFTNIEANNRDLDNELKELSK